MSSALLTDRYELTMLDAARRGGVAEVPATFEVFARRLPPGRTFGVFAGLARLVEALERFRFGADELSWLASEGVVSTATLDWLEAYRFSGRIEAYREGELYAAGSPVLTVEASFAEAVLLETLILSVLNHDAAVAAAAALIVGAAGGRPLIEMGSRRTDPEAAVAAARAAYLVGFASTSNLEAGRRYGIPTAGTSAHAFILMYPSEREAFGAQVDALGPGTTLLVDTYDVEEGIRNAVDAAGPALGAIRIDSGDLAREAWRARGLLDRLGATRTRVVVTGDLDDRALRELSGAPVDGYGVGTHVVTGLGAPTAGFVYKLVAVGRSPAAAVPAVSVVPGVPGVPAVSGVSAVPTEAAGDGAWRSVAKQSPGKATVGGKKWAWRVREGGTARGAVPILCDFIGDRAADAPDGGQALQVEVAAGGEFADLPSLVQSRAWCAGRLGELAPGGSVLLRRQDD